MHGGDEAQAPADPAFGSWETDLHSFHPHAVFSPLATGQFTNVQTLATAIHGKVYRMLLHRQVLPDPDAAASVDPADVHEEGELVVVKKMPTWKVRQGQAGENNDRRAHRMSLGNTEDALNEIGVLMFFSQSAVQCPFILRIVGCWEDEKNTWLTTENCDSELFQLAASGEQLDESVVRRFTFQLLKAVEHMHSHNIGHRDISLENLLVKANSLRLMDFGQAVLLNSAEGVPYRYFAQAGKAYYRAPEAYVPKQTIQAQVPGEGWAPGTVVQVRGAGGYFCEVHFGGAPAPGEVAPAEPYGYTVAPCDAFACGVCMFILQTQQPPWRTATLADALFAYINENGVRAILQAWKRPELPPDAMDVMSGLLQGWIMHRWGVANALASPWFAGEAGEG